MGRKVRLAVAYVTALTMVGDSACGDEPQLGQFGAEVDPPTEFFHPLTCATCHPTQFREWRGSVMHYAAISPVFNAFEMTVAELSDGLFAANGEEPNFCNGCHSPIGVFNDEIGDFDSASEPRPMRSFLSDVALDGVSCDFCHTVRGPDLERSPLGDGIANVALQFAPSWTRYGPFADAESPFHFAEESDFLRSSEFCGSCHDVRLPRPDQVTGEPFQRLENLFTEWQEGPYSSSDNPFGRVVRCQDCHMSLYPMTEPGVFPEVRIATRTADLPVRRHALHAFTAVSFPVIDDPNFPNVDTPERDEFGYPMGQVQRREQMLRAACTLSLQDTALELPPDADTIPIRVVVTNVGAGHRVPAGFSQERQVWIELVVSDDEGVLYESGYLRDAPHPETGEPEPDGRLHDEDLDDRHYEVDLQTLDSAVHPGADRNQRPAHNLGLVNFQNEFVRIGPEGVWEPIVNPLLADHIDNSHSLDMLVPRRVSYDVPRPDRPLVGPVRVSARLRYRAFPPHFLRTLAQRHPDLVTEAIVDANTIVDMASDEVVIGIVRE